MWLRKHLHTTNRKATVRHWAILTLVVLVVNGCASAGADMGVAGPVSLTERGASSTVEASLEQASERTRRAFSAMGIRMKEVETRDHERTFKGVTRTLDVTAELDRNEQGVTRIEVTARRNAESWDREFAQRVLSRIVRRG